MREVVITRMPFMSRERHAMMVTELTLFNCIDGIITYWLVSIH